MFSVFGKTTRHKSSIKKKKKIQVHIFFFSKIPCNIHRTSTAKLNLKLQLFIILLIMDNTIQQILLLLIMLSNC